ncbi:MAG: hypothetical protein U0Z75_05365 [Deinococcaceae bacterium]
MKKSILKTVFLGLLGLSFVAQATSQSSQAKPKIPCKLNIEGNCIGWPV